MEEWIEERIKENEILFTKEEIDVINNNKSLIKKIYILAIINCL